jgi:hypothetical protein
VFNSKNEKEKYMKLNNTISITPPPFINNIGVTVFPSLLLLNSLDFMLTDNSKNKIVSVDIMGIPSPITLWSGKDYDNAGDYTQAQAESKLLDLLGNDPAATLRALFPKTLEENPNGPGTVLVKSIKGLGFVISDSCACKNQLLEMNDKGADWCVENITKIVSWLKIQAQNINIVFIDSVAKVIIMRAIKKSKLLLANQTVPQNDEELDNLL